MPRRSAAAKESRGGALQLGSQEMGSFRPSLHGACWRTSYEAASEQACNEHPLRVRCLMPDGSWYGQPHRSATSVLPWPANRQADTNLVCWAGRGRLIGRCFPVGPRRRLRAELPLPHPPEEPSSSSSASAAAADEASLERQQIRSCIYAVNEPKLLTEPITSLMNAFQSKFRPR